MSVITVQQTVHTFQPRPHGEYGRSSTLPDGVAGTCESLAPGGQRSRRCIHPDGTEVPVHVTLNAPNSKQ